MLRGRRRDDRRDLQALPRQGDHGDPSPGARGRRGGGRARRSPSRPGIRSATIFLLKYGPQAAELQEGVAFHGRAGHARSSARWSGCRSTRWRSSGRTASSSPAPTTSTCRAWLKRELRIVQPRLVVVMGEDALRFLNERRVPALASAERYAGRAPAVHADDRGARTSRTSTSHSTSSPRRRAFGTRSSPSAPGGPSCRPTSRSRRALVAWYEIAPHLGAFRLGRASPDRRARR